MFPLKFSFLSQKLINTDLHSLATANIFCQSTAFGHPPPSVASINT